MTKRSALSFNGFLVGLNDKVFIQELFFAAGYNDLEGMACEYCTGGKYRLIKNNRIPIGMNYRCSNRTCFKVLSFFKNNVFLNNDLKLFLTLLASFIRNKSIASVIIDNNFDEKSVYKYYNFFRELCFINIPHEIILGGEGREVELDETHLYKRKYHKGRVLASQDIWVFGIYERGTKKVFLQSVNKRDAETLYEIVHNHVAPGTKIYTDGWAGYSKVKRYFETRSVNHKLYYVDPEDPLIHINNIERTWRSLKEDLRGACNEQYDEHLSEFMFRRLFLNGEFKHDLIEILKLIKDY